MTDPETPDALREAAARDRRRAGELAAGAADWPAGYAEYLERRADWREYLARQREADPLPKSGY